jgi:peptide chain release factor 2
MELPCPPFWDPLTLFLPPPDHASLRTADGMTVDSIADKGWTILAEAESDWRSHAAAVAQSIKLIKKRLKVQFL